MRVCAVWEKEHGLCCCEGHARVRVRSAIRACVCVCLCARSTGDKRNKASAKARRNNEGRKPVAPTCAARVCAVDGARSLPG